MATAVQFYDKGGGATGKQNATVCSKYYGVCGLGLMIFLEASVFVTILVGFLGTIVKKNLLMKIVTMDVMGTGIVALFVVIATHSGLVTPIARGGVFDTAYADPVPQAVILTAIVIGLSIQTLMLVAAMKLARDNPTLETPEIDQKYL